MNQRRIAVFIADVLPHVREGLSALLSTDPEFINAGLAASAGVATTEAVRLRPDLILIDPIFGKNQSWEIIARLKQNLPEAIILIHRSDITPEQMLAAMQRGASDVIHKSLPPGMLISRLKMAGAHQFRIHPALASGLVGIVGRRSELPPSSRPLSPAEWEVLQLAVNHPSVSEIAGHLGENPAAVFKLNASLIEKVHDAYRTNTALVVAPDAP